MAPGGVGDRAGRERWPASWSGRGAGAAARRRPPWPYRRCSARPRSAKAPLRGGRLLRAAELAFELGRHDLVLGLLAQAEPLDLGPREQARVAWIRESFADGIPGDAARVRSLAATAEPRGR